MNADTEVFMGVISTPNASEELSIAHWKFDGSFTEATNGRLWLDEAGLVIDVGNEYLLTGSFKRWSVAVTDAAGTNKDGQMQWRFRVIEEIW